MSLLTARLAALDAAVPPVRKPAEMLGEVVFKQFKGHGTFIGTIMEYDAQTGFRLQYDDGDTEDVSWNDLRTMMMPRGTGEAMPPGPRERHAQSVKPNQYAIVPSVRRAVETPAPVAAAEEAVAAPAEPAAPLRPPAAAPPPGARKKQLLAAIARQQQHEELRADDAPAEKRPVAAPSVPPPPKKQKAAAAQGGVEQRKPKAPAAAAAPNAVDISQLPAGWMTEARGRNTVYISPDGLTQFSTLAKVQRYHKQQMALAERFQQQQEAAERRKRQQAEEQARRAAEVEEASHSAATDGEAAANGPEEKVGGEAKSASPPASAPSASADMGVVFDAAGRSLDPPVSHATAPTVPPPPLRSPRSSTTSTPNPRSPVRSPRAQSLRARSTDENTVTGETPSALSNITSLSSPVGGGAKSALGGPKRSPRLGGPAPGGAPVASTGTMMGGDAADAKTNEAGPILGTAERRPSHGGGNFAAAATSRRAEEG